MRTLIKIGGSLLDDPHSRENIAQQIAAAAKSGSEIAVVHGGGKQMTRFLEDRGIQSTFVRGLRVTTPETIDAVLKVLAGAVNTGLVAALSVAGIKPVGLTGVDAGLAMAEQLDPELGAVGRVIGSDPALLDLLVGHRYLPVIACIASGRAGEVYNVNGDSMAVSIASKWKVDKLLFLTDVTGVLNAERQLVPVLTAAECRQLITEGIATGGMQAKLNAAAEAVEGGVQEVQIVKGSEPDICRRVFDGENAGTRIVRPHRDPLIEFITAVVQ